MASFSRSLFYFKLFTICLGLNALAAYAVGPIPVQWLSYVSFLGLGFWMLARSRIVNFPGMILLMLLFLWSFITTAYNVSVYGDPTLLPSNASTSYFSYIGLRFMMIMVFGAVIAIAYALLRDGHKDRLINFIVNLGFWVSIFSLYVYVAQIYGLPEPPRTRIGTSGVAGQKTHFSYAFHRAMGSFREPSHLAEWLVVPLFLSFYNSRRAISIKSIVIMGVLLLTGSLTGIVSAVGGFIAATIIGFGVNIKSILAPLKVVMPLLLAGGIFSVLAVGNKAGKEFSLTDVLMGRLEPAAEKGVGATNRDYIYDYVEVNKFPLWGYGVGNATFIFSQHVGVGATVSFLSLYLFFIFSTGIVGFVLLLVFMGYPIWLYLKNKFRVKDYKFPFLIGAYIAWFLIYAVHAEEFSVPFAVAYALIVYSVVYEPRLSLAKEKA